MKIGRMIGPAIATHAALVTGVHGVGADSIISDAEVTAQVGDALTAAIAAIGIHSDNDTGVHGVGESTVYSEAEAAALVAAEATARDAAIAAHAALFGLHNKIVRKTADEVVNNSDVLQDDNHLFLAMGVNEVWAVTLVLDSLNCPTQAKGVKGAIVIPAGATMLWRSHSLDDAVTQTQRFSTTSGEGHPLTSTPAAKRGLTVIHAIITNGGNAGNMQFQWAQSGAIAEDVTLKANSYLIAHELA